MFCSNRPPPLPSWPSAPRVPVPKPVRRRRPTPRRLSDTVTSPNEAKPPIATASPPPLPPSPPSPPLSAPPPLPPAPPSPARLLLRVLFVADSDENEALNTPPPHPPALPFPLVAGASGSTLPGRVSDDRAAGEGERARVVDAAACPTRSAVVTEPSPGRPGSGAVVDHLAVGERERAAVVDPAAVAARAAGTGGAVEGIRVAATLSGLVVGHNDASQGQRTEVPDPTAALALRAGGAAGLRVRPRAPGRR